MRRKGRVVGLFGIGAATRSVSDAFNPEQFLGDGQKIFALKAIS